MSMDPVFEKPIEGFVSGAGRLGEGKSCLKAVGGSTNNGKKRTCRMKARKSF